MNAFITGLKISERDSILSGIQAGQRYQTYIPAF
jgi:hypothetical protein